MNFRTTWMRALIATAALIIGSQAFAARTTTFYHNDGLGSVVAATNEAGAVLWRKDYAPFGEQIDTTPETERTAYTGKQHDDVTGLTNFGARNFDPEIGRFMSVDPVGFVEDNTMSFNRYLYVNNNPYKYVDPDGEFLNFAAKFILDVGINIAFNYVTSGSFGVGMALKEAATGILNPAKTLVKAKKLANAVTKVNKSQNGGVKVAREITLSRKAHGEAAHHADDAIKSGHPAVWNSPASVDTVLT
jgi:RHS repeat-associated protein